jgi:LL-diaminopimelate aminotransferase
MKLNSNLYSFSDNTFYNVTEKVNKYKEKHPDNKIISLGVGDVSKPVVKSIIEAMHKAVDDQANMETFKGYGAYYGYDFLKDVILENEYKDFGFTRDEIYISNGTKSDSTNILELFDIDSKICVSDPMYPIYMAGAKILNRNITCLDCNEDNNFIPTIPKEKYDIIYICSPSNPTGTCYTYDDLEKWIRYAKENKAVILYDNVYNAFIRSKNVPKSIYEIDGAKEVAIEFRSFSKVASFTGLRCSYYIIPNEIDKDINYYWKNRTINRFNGADYIVQKGAMEVYSDSAKKEIKKNIDDYLEGAKKLRRVFENNGYSVYGGIDSPFLWIKTKDGMDSWEFFDFFLEKLNIIIIPGIIFGSNGDKYFRVSALASKGVIDEAIERINKYYEK